MLLQLLLHLCTQGGGGFSSAFNCIWRSDFDILGSIYLLYTLSCTGSSAAADCWSRGGGGGGKL